MYVVLSIYIDRPHSSHLLYTTVNSFFNSSTLLLKITVASAYRKLLILVPPSFTPDKHISGNMFSLNRLNNSGDKT